MKKKFSALLIFFVLCSLSAAEQIPVLTVPWKPVPDQTELFARTGKMCDISCNGYGMTFYIREKTAGEPLCVLIAPGREMEQGYLTITCKTQPKRSVESGFHVVPGLFADHIEAEFRRDNTGKNVCRITVPWENLSTILPEKALRVVIGGEYLPVQMPDAYFSAKNGIESTILSAFSARTFFQIPKKENMSYRESLRQFLGYIENDSSKRVRYLRAVFTEVTP